MLHIIRAHSAPVLLFALIAAAGRAQVVAVLPRVETAPVSSTGDAADDIAVWVHPTDPGQSLVIGTNKRAGIAVYDLGGSQLQFLADGELNNVDLRYGFPSAPGNAIVTSGERSQNLLAVYFVDPNARRLVNAAARSIGLGFAVYGCCMYHSHVNGDFYFFGTSASGHVEQWRLFANGAGRVDAAPVRQFEVGSVAEGCVADDENGWFFVAEENVGIWRYSAEPGAGTARVLVDPTGAGGHLTADIEGLSIYYAAQGGGYLLASSQGSSTFVVYQRAAPHAYLRTFQITANTALGIDAVTGTDGIDVANLGLGSTFPGGVFVAQDDSNPGANQNFKLVSWADVANAANPPLLVDSTFDVHGALCDPAAWSYRNGSGRNPQILTNQLPPVLGGTWSSTLDCTGSSPGLAVVAVFGRPAAGFFVGPYEVLVDLSSPFLFSLDSLHASSAVPFSVPVPANLGLCGMQVSVQGACVDALLVLSNAIDLTLGS